MKITDIFTNMVRSGETELRLDPWAGGQQQRQYRLLEQTSGVINFCGLRFDVKHKDGGGAGMGAYPPTIRVEILDEFNETTHPEIYL